MFTAHFWRSEDSVLFFTMWVLETELSHPAVLPALFLTLESLLPCKLVSDSRPAALLWGDCCDYPLFTGKGDLPEVTDSIAYLLQAPRWGWGRPRCPGYYLGCPLD